MHRIKNFAFRMSRGVIQISQYFQKLIGENDLFMDVEQPKVTYRPEQEGKQSE